MHAAILGASQLSSSIIVSYVGALFITIFNTIFPLIFISACPQVDLTQIITLLIGLTASVGPLYATIGSNNREWLANHLTFTYSTLYGGMFASLTGMMYTSIKCS